MYLWKCWRDTRVPFVVILSCVAAFWWIVHSQVLLMNKFMHGGLFVLDTEGVEGYWKDLAGIIGGTGKYLVVPCIFTMTFGSSGVGAEFARGTADFLLTRPRFRRYFVWVSWSTAAFEILTIVLAYVLLAFLAAIYVTGTVYTWKFLLMVLPIFLMGIVAYSLVYLMAALQRSGRKGYASGLGFVAIYPLLADLFPKRWSIHLPNPVHLMNPFSQLASDPHASAAASHFPFAAVIGWSLFALACPLLAQLYIERSEV